MPSLNTYGDATVGVQAKRIVFVSDSILNTVWPSLAMYLGKVSGIPCYHVADGVGGIVNAAFQNQPYGWNANEWSGSSTLNGATIIGATTATINAPANGNGAPSPLMKCYISEGQADAETVDLAPYGTYTQHSNNFVFRTALTKAHANGATIRWERPSAVDHYWPNVVQELPINSGTFTDTNPLNANLGQWRIKDQYTAGGENGHTERWFFSDGQTFTNSAIRFTLFYLAHPRGVDGAFTLFGWGSDKTSRAQAFANFDTFAATPEIRKVSVELPAPTAGDTAQGPLCTVALRTATTFGTGKVFVPLACIAEKITGVGGTVLPGRTLFFHGFSGANTLQFDGVGTATYGANASPAFMQQFVTLAGIDTLFVQTGTNDTFADAPTMQAALSRVKSTYNAPRTIFCSTYALGDYFSTTLTAGLTANVTTSLSVVSALGLKAKTKILVGTGGTKDYLFVTQTAANEANPIVVDYAPANNHAIGETVSWLASVPAVSNRARMGPVIQSAMIGMANANLNVMTIDGYGTFGDAEALQERFLSDDHLHPISNQAQEWWCGWIGNSITSILLAGTLLGKTMSLIG